MSRSTRWFAACVLVGSVAAHAEPWLAPGDEGLRSDIELLADAGILRGPVTTWPMSWPDVARDVLGAQFEGLDAPTADALIRVQRLARDAGARGFSGAGMRVSGSDRPTELRTFAETPREEGELAVGASWLGNHLALKLAGTAVSSPSDGQSFRPDGSWLGVNVGNFMISAGYIERWWGPGWEGSLILSTNARPIPSLTLERNYSDPFKSPFLSWIGPWRASIAVGEEEGSGVEVPDVRFMAARVNFRPRPWLELGLSRTAQWCGGDRNCDFGTFRDMLLGRDNRSADLSAADEPGNQMAGYDLRIRSPWRKLPLVAYTQWIGEDEAGGLPSKFLGQFGMETWIHMGLGTLRMRAEYTDTTCSFTRQRPQFDCGYRNSLYPQGYSYRGRIIGDALDNDSRMTSVAALLTRPSGETFSLLVRHIDVNRDGGAHALSISPRKINNVELRHSREWAWGRLTLGVGYDDDGLGEESASSARGFLTWQQGF